MKKIIVLIVTVCMFISAVLVVLSSCDFKVTESGSQADKTKTINAANTLQANQPTPTDISYSLER